MPRGLGAPGRSLLPSKCSRSHDAGDEVAPHVGGGLDLRAGVLVKEAGTQLERQQAVDDLVKRTLPRKVRRSRGGVRFELTNDGALNGQKTCRAVRDFADEEEAY